MTNEELVKIYQTTLNKEEKKRVIGMLYDNNKNLIIQTIKRYFPLLSYTGFEDALQVAFFGVVSAAEHFDGNHGCKFSTYLVPWVRSHISRDITNGGNGGNIIRLPVHLYDNIIKCNQYKEKYFTEYNEYPSETHIAEHFGWTEENTRYITAGFVPTLSLEATLSPEEDRDFCVENIIADATVRPPEEETIQKELKSELLTCIRKYSNNERNYDIFCYRYGLRGNDEHTLEETGEKFGMTRERVRQINDRIIKKIQKSKHTMDKLQVYIR